MSPEIATELEKAYGPVQSLFEISAVPEGGAPLEIREQWLGVELPVRALYVARFSFGYIGRRFMPSSEDNVRIDAITGKLIDDSDVWGKVEVHGYDAVDSLVDASRQEAAEFWKPYEEAVLGFRLYEGYFKTLKQTKRA